MEIIKLGTCSLKISLSSEEAGKCDFSKNKDDIDYENSGSLKFILDKAKKEVGFDVKGRLCVEIYTAPSGECEIFVSKAKERSYKEKNNDQQKRSIGARSIYVFDRLEDILSACKRLADNTSFEIKSKIYYDKNKYYIFLFDTDTKDIKYSFLTEYSKYIKNSAALYILERGKCLCEKKGVEIFSKLL